MSKFDDMCLILGDAGETVRATVDRIGDKWTLVVIATLHEKRLRFGALQQQIPGVSQRMLSRTLRNLERDGLVSRTAHGEVPPRVEYELTAMGEALTAPAMVLASWAAQNNPAIQASRAAYERR